MPLFIVCPNTHTLPFFIEVISENTAEQRD
jgi:hypothetical protein